MFGRAENLPDLRKVPENIHDSEYLWAGSLWLFHLPGTTRRRC